MHIQPLSVFFPNFPRGSKTSILLLLLSGRLCPPRGQSTDQYTYPRPQMMDMPRNEWKDEQLQQRQQLVLRQALSRQRSLPESHKNNDHHKSLSREELKLAAVAISLNIRLRSADMPISILERAFRCAGSLLDTSAAASTSASHRPSPTLLARSLKKEFDSLYGPAWHCVVGKSFGSFVTHSPGGFVYFSLDSFSFLLFKTEVHLVKD